MPTTCLKITDPRWLSFIARHPEATPFHHPAWVKLQTECYGYPSLLLATLGPEGQIEAGLPLMYVRSWLTGRRVVGLPFSDFCPPLAVDGAGLRDLMVGLQDQQQLRHWPQVEVRWQLPSQPGVYPGETVARHVTPLSANVEQVFRSFKGSVGRLIRQAEKAGLDVKFGETWEDIRLFYNLHLESRRRLGAPVQPLRFFRLLWQQLLSRELGFVLLAYKDGQPIAGAVFLRWNKVLIYKYGASLSAYWHLRPNNLLFSRAIRFGCEEGYELFDWGRTDLEDEGLRSFKRGWGSEESRVQYSVLADHPPSPRTPDSRRRLLALLIRRSPLWVGRALGEALYGHFG